MRRALPLVLGLLAATRAGADEADAPSLVVMAAQDGKPVVTPRVKVGEAFHVVVTVTARPDVVVGMPAAFDTGAFEVLERREQTTAAGGREFDLSVVAWKPGRQTFPGVPITYVPRGEGQLRQIATSSLDVDVLAVLPAEAAVQAELRDVAPPVPIFEKDWTLVIIAAAGLGGLIAFFALYFVLRAMRRRRARVRAAAPVVDLRPPEEIALDKLRALAASPLLDEDDRKPFYFALTDVVREYLGRRFAFGALDMTSSELLAALGVSPAPKELGDEVALWLSGCDLVKFARMPASRDDATAALAAARALIDRGAPAPEPAVLAAPPGRLPVRDRWERLWVVLSPYAYLVVVAGIAAVVADATISHDRGTLSFAKRDVLVLLAGCVLLAWVGFHLHRRRAATFSFSRVADLRRSGRGVVAWLAPLPRVFRVAAIGLIAIGLARPQTYAREVVEVEGIDIMIVLDLSKSMTERDLKRNRLDAAQRTIRRFIKNRNDRVGLVVFARNSMLQCPLTLDMSALDRIVADLNIGDINYMGTAIGDGVGLAVASLRRSDARSKVIILLTDGDSNVTNEMSPEEALAAAKDRSIRVFTVLMGRETAVEIDELGRRAYATNPTLLKTMASESGGRYYHAGDDDALARGFDEVRATLEKDKRKEFRRVPTELYRSFIIPALVLLLLEVALSLTRLRRFP